MAGGSGHGEKLSRHQEQAIAALLTQPSIATAAATAGVAERTLKTWLALPAFQVAYQAARKELLDRTVGQLLAACGEAVQALQQNLTADRPSDRTKAALAILGLAIKGCETLTLTEEVAALKAIVVQQQGNEQ